MKFFSHPPAHTRLVYPLWAHRHRTHPYHARGEPRPRTHNSQARDCYSTQPATTTATIELARARNSGWGRARSRVHCQSCLFCRCSSRRGTG
jgi:hypothetical protein